MPEHNNYFGDDHSIKPNENLNRINTCSPAELPARLQAGIGLAIASMAMGIMSLGLAIFAIGAIAGLVGAILAIIHLSKQLPLKGIAIWGLVLSIIGTAAGLGFGTLMYRSYQLMADLGDEQFQQYYGTEVPELVLTTIDGNEIKLSELRGRRVLLDFWATWCPPCKKQIPHLIQLRKTTKTEELAIIGISDEPVQKIRAFAEKTNINYSLASIKDDSTLPEPFSEVTSIPTLFLIDANGIIEIALSGYHRFDTLKRYALGPEQQQPESLSE